MITYVFSALSADFYLIRPEQDTLRPCCHSFNQKWTSKENRDNKVDLVKKLLLNIWDGET